MKGRENGTKEKRKAKGKLTTHKAFISERPVLEFPNLMFCLPCISG